MRSGDMDQAALVVGCRGGCQSVFISVPVFEGGGGIWMWDVGAFDYPIGFLPFTSLTQVLSLKPRRKGLRLGVAYA